MEHGIGTSLRTQQKLTADSNGKHPGDKGFDKSNVKQWGTTLNGWPPVQICIWQNGGDVISEDLTNSPIDTKEAKGGFKFYADLINSDMVPTQQIIKDRGFDTMFKNQQVAMFMGGAADSLETQVKFKCAVAEVPAGPTGIKATFGDILGMGINVNTKMQMQHLMHSLTLHRQLMSGKLCHRENHLQLRKR